jgi:hypothetical protein
MIKQNTSFFYLRSARYRRSRANWNMRLKSYVACKILIHASNIIETERFSIIPIVPISLGELIDKITILEVKKERINDKDKLAYIILELDLLLDVYCDTSKGITYEKQRELENIKRELKTVNEKLWDIEDGIRESEKNRDWASDQKVDHFITLARSVYHTNDERAKLKLKINNLMGSTISEVKSYSDYQGDL